MLECFHANPDIERTVKRQDIVGVSRRLEDEPGIAAEAMLRRSQADRLTVLLPALPTGIQPA